MGDAPTRAAVRLVRVPDDRDGQRLDNFLTTQLKGLPRSAIHRLIRTGQVRVNGGRAKSATRLEAGDEVRVPPARLRQGGPPAVPPGAVRHVEHSVVYDDGDILVIDKPSGMAVHAGSGLAWGVIDALRASRLAADIELVHRLDRETSGLLMLARQRKTLLDLQRQWREERVGKRYLCGLDGVLAEDRVVVDAPLRKIRRGGEHQVVVDNDGQEARTTFSARQRLAGATLCEAQLHTGRTHQIRAHAVHLGLPLLGDERYADNERLAFWKRHGLRRLFLHAHRLDFADARGDAVTVESPLPDELRDLLSHLEGSTDEG